MGKNLNMDFSTLGIYLIILWAQIENVIYLQAKRIHSRYPARCITVDGIVTGPETRKWFWASIFQSCDSANYFVCKIIRACIEIARKNHCICPTLRHSYKLGRIERLYKSVSMIFVIFKVIVCVKLWKIIIYNEKWREE